MCIENDNVALHIDHTACERRGITHGRVGRTGFLTQPANPKPEYFTISLAKMLTPLSIMVELCMARLKSLGAILP